MQSLAHTLRRQLMADNIRVMSVAPRMVANELWGITAPEDIARHLAEHSALSSEDVARAVVRVELARFQQDFPLRSVLRPPPPGGGRALGADPWLARYPIGAGRESQRPGGALRPVARNRRDGRRSGRCATRRQQHGQRQHDNDRFLHDILLVES